MFRHSKPRGAWATFPEPSEIDHEAELTWEQICAKVDELLAEDRPHVHRFPWAEGKKRRPSKVTILPHGARQIKIYWDLEDEPNQ